MMIIAAISWLVAGAVAGLLVERALRLGQLRDARKVTLPQFARQLSTGLYGVLHTEGHDEFLAQYSGLMRLTFAWLLAQLRLMIAHLAIGGTVYLLAYVLMTTFSLELMNQLGSVGCDAFFLIGACASYAWCNVSSHRHRPAGSAGGSL